MLNLLKYTFIGYGGDEFGYRFLDKQNRKIIRSRDMVFNELVLYKYRLSALDSDNTDSRVVELDISNLCGRNGIQNEVIDEEELSTPPPFRYKDRI